MGSSGIQPTDRNPPDGPSMELPVLRRRAPYTVSVNDATPPTYVSLLQSRQDCRDVIREFIYDNVGNRGFRFIRSSVIAAHPPGVGKTTAVVESLNELNIHDESPSVLVVAPTHALLDEIESKLNVPASHVRGRTEGSEEPLCAHLPIAKAMARKRLPMHENICNTTCPERPGCLYYAQFGSASPVWLVTPRMARSKRFVHGKIGGEDVDWRAVVYDDVDPLNAFVDDVSVTATDLLDTAARERMAFWEPLLTAIASVVAHARDSLSGMELWQQFEIKLGLPALTHYVACLCEGPIPPDPQPNLPADRMPTIEEVRAQLPVFVRPLFRALQQEGEAFLTSRGTQPLLVAKDRKLTVRWSDIPRYLDYAPALVLDATPDVIAWRRILGLLPVITGTEPVALSPSCRITQVADHFNGKTALESPRRLKKLQEQIRRVLATCPTPALVISYKDIVPRLDGLYGEADVQFAHYYALRGLNKFADAQTLIVVGCPNPNMSGLCAQAAAFYGGTEPLRLSFKLCPEAYVSTNPQERWMVETVHWEDERLQSILRTRREGELLQVIFRLRPLQRQSSCSVWVFSEQPIPLVPVHLTGIGGVYCGELDDRTNAICIAVSELLEETEAVGKEAVESGEVAQRAFGARDRYSRSMVTNTNVLREVAHHTGIKASKDFASRPLERGGLSKYPVWLFHR